MAGRCFVVVTSKFVDRQIGDDLTDLLRRKVSGECCHLPFLSVANARGDLLIVGRLRVGDDTLTVPTHGGVLVGPGQLRQVFNDTEGDVLWLIVGAPEEVEFLSGAKTKPDMSLIYPVDPKQLPKELAGMEWPPET